MNEQLQVCAAMAATACIQLACFDGPALAPLQASGVEVRRVCITRMVDGIFYSRIVLSRPNEPGGGSEAGASSLCSLDATPGDSLSLALALRRPIYVNNEVVRCVARIGLVAALRAGAASSALPCDHYQRIPCSTHRSHACYRYPCYRPLMPIPPAPHPPSRPSLTSPTRSGCTAR